MSWISDTFAGLKRIMQLDSDVEQLKRAVEKIDAIAMDHEKRLVRIETLIEIGRAPIRLPPP
jgi:hypothetical protein